MPTVRDILATKGSQIFSIGPQATVLQATQLMNQHKVGALVVMHEEQVVGMFTERDVLRRVVAEQRLPADVTLADVMTSEVICCEPDMDLDDASTIMQQRRIRHLPICDNDGNLLGMISIGDLNALHASHQEQTIHFLNDYIYGRA
ncbi:MAG: CBS domain-containing protein [Phycisphaerales bacterium]|jgi:CBS domain-containing protein|nr:CBS domain-containing protein [Phycisphaerales bacterium]